MSSPGQIVGGIAGAALGFFVPGLGPILGAQLGLMVGGMIDPPKGPSITGPRLEDLSVQTSTYGAPLPRGYGTVCVSGNVFWLEGDQLKEWTTTEESGGKGGGGGGEVTQYHYSATFAVGLMHVPAGATVSLRRLWIDTDLVYEAGSDNVESIIASNSGHGFLAGSAIWQEVGTWWLNAITGINFTFYSGTDDQLPNARMQADKGAANVSAYPGMCYLVFEDLSLEKYSNTLLRAQVKAELVIAPATTDTDLAQSLDVAATGMTAYPSAVMFSGSHIAYAVLESESWGGGLEWAKVKSFEVGVGNQKESAIDLATGLPVTYYLPCFVSCADRPVVLFLSGIGYPTTTGVQLWLVDIEPVQGPTIPLSSLPYENLVAAIDGTDIFLAVFNGTGPVVKTVGLNYQAGTSGSYRIMSLGLSDNYLFAVQEPSPSDTSTTTTIFKFSRFDLSLIATYVANLPSPATISVVDDDTFYTAHTDSHVHKWIDGVPTLDLGAVFPHDFGLSITRRRWFRVLNDNPVYVHGVVGSPTNSADLYIGHALVPASAAKLRDIVTDECALAGIAAGDIDLASLTNSDVRGFRVAQRGAVRNSLEPLQAAFPFDVAQSGYKIKFVSRGGASVASIPEENLAATDGTPGVLLPVAREMDSQLPFRVSIRYTDPDREYDIGEQSVERYEKDSLNERVMELPLSLTSGEAIQMADVLLAKEWTERVEFGPFALPPTWRHLEPSDVVTVTHRGQDYTLRLTRVEYFPDGRLVCNAKLTAAACYTSSATAQSPLVAGQSLVPLKGSTQGYLLDIPRIRSEQDVPGMAYAMTGMASGWPGATLLRSDDSGNTYQAIGAVNARAKVFVASGTIGSHHGYSIDHGSVLTVTPRYAGHTLSSITEDQLYAHTNIAAYGSDGRWEIVAFKTAVDNTGSYSLKDFLRGLYGTEWASGLHANGDYLVMLDTATISFFGLPTNAIGSARLYRAITQGASLDSAADVSDIYEAHNLKPLSPVDFKAWRDPASWAWNLSWARRTRWPVELFSGATVPLGESAESYELDIYDSGYSALKRSIAATSESAQWTEAQQIADFGVKQQTIYYKLRQKSSVVGAGYDLTGSKTLVVSEDPYIEYVVLLMQCDDAAMIDQRGKTVTLNGNAALSSTNGGSCYLDGSGDYLEVAASNDFNLGTAWTIEFFYQPATSSHTGKVISTRNASSSGYEIGIYNSGSGNKLLVEGWGGNSTGGAKWGTTTVASGVEKHIAVTHDGSNVRAYLGGVHELAFASTASWAAAGQVLRIGLPIPYNEPCNGYIRKIRFTKGVARYTGTGSFTPPTSFPNP